MNATISGFEMHSRLVTLCLALALAACGGETNTGPSPQSDAGQDAGDSADADQTDGGTMTSELIGSDELVFDDGTFSVDVYDNGNGTRTYEASTTYQNLLAGLPSQRTFSEAPDRIRLRSGRLAFDALFALAVFEADENAVEQISDGAFNNGEGVPCSCYETGEEWNYVWTRDTAYAADLGLTWIDPARVQRSLEFKLSARKEGGAEEVVQDTGTGGSWPVSTDRVTWFIGSGALIPFADDAFLDRRRAVAAQTTEVDREVVFDAERGLYRGEQSFLDWREQSYPRWTATKTRHIAQSHALSTNLAHLRALYAAGREADAEALRQAIVETFWDEDAGLYRAMTATELDGSVPAKYDLLGNSLAVLMGLPNADRVVASYPYGPNGASVIWPQQPRIPIYHNRGQWPFVTAYAARAAAARGNTGVFERNANALIRGAALNLSNMENFEFLSGHPRVEDGEFSGPVVNSRRQLWSVAGYVGLVVDTIFGLQLSPNDGATRLRARPFVPVSLRDTYFPDSTALRLENVMVDGVARTVTLVLPPSTGDGYLTHQRAFEDIPEPADTVDYQYVLEPAAAQSDALTEVGDPSDFRNIFAPLEPTDVAVASSGGTVDVSWTEPEPGVTYEVYRDGDLVAADLSTTTWADTLAPATYSPCYSVVAKFPTGLESHPSEPACWFGTNGSRVQIRDVWTMAEQGGAWSTEHGRAHIGSWGDPGHTITGAPFRPRWTGRHAVQIAYGNGSNGFTTGITAAVKKLTVRNVTDDTTETRWVVMPQRNDWANWGTSTLQYVELDAAKIYEWRLEDGVNMSYFDHFTSYTAGPGGGDAPFNAANIHAVEFLPISGQPAPASTRGPVPLNGTDDFGKYATEATSIPGARLQDWSRFAIDSDDDHVYITQVSEAFEGDFTPWMVYFGDGDTGTGSRQGMEYDGLTSELPFAADWAIGLRVTSDSPEGPWNGLFRWDGTNWVRERRFELNRDYWVAADRHTLSVRVPRASLRGSSTVQVASHIVYAQPGNEWKETVPDDHTPWTPSTTGYLTVELDP